MIRRVEASYTRQEVDREEESQHVSANREVQVAAGQAVFLATTRCHMLNHFNATTNILGMQEYVTKWNVFSLISWYNS
jgi:hypothetical protein